MALAMVLRLRRTELGRGMPGIRSIGLTDGQRRGSCGVGRT
jgi:hypothetical protein